jgi:hypothetical protein
MGHIEDDKALCEGRQMYGELPCDGPTPIVTHADGFVFSKVANDGLNISYQVTHRVILSPLGFIAKVVAAQI